jgi:geranylgeranyl pyrophosphate synthase
MNARHEPEAQLQEVRALMARSLGETALSRLAGDSHQWLGSGKMLRSRLCLRLGEALGTPLPSLLHACAAVEMIHAASLLHDDVIDGGFIRRNLPTFWVERGVSGAILVGDLMLFKALDLLGNVENGRLVHALVRMTGEVCDAETEQELVLRGKTPTWPNCVAIARRKTGALFAFAAFAAAGPEADLAGVMQESGYAVGTAYQLADDILDVSGLEDEAGKTLGTDEARMKTTAASAAATTGVDPVAYIDDLCEQAESALTPWPVAHRAWRQFVDEDFRPSIERPLAAFAGS